MNIAELTEHLAKQLAVAGNLNDRLASVVTDLIGDAPPMPTLGERASSSDNRDAVQLGGLTGTLEGQINELQSINASIERSISRLAHASGVETLNEPKAPR